MSMEYRHICASTIGHVTPVAITWEIKQVPYNSVKSLPMYYVAIFSDC